MTFLHQNTVVGRWETMSFMEQMGNIGSEVGRTRIALDAHPERFQGAFYRALDLFDRTLADERWHGRRFELARARELFCAASLRQEEYGTSLADLDNYFMQFAMAAALRRDTANSRDAQ